MTRKNAGNTQLLLRDRAQKVFFMNAKRELKRIITKTPLNQLKTASCCMRLYTIIRSYAFKKVLPNLALIEWVHNLRNNANQRCYGLTSTAGDDQKAKMQFCTSINNKRKFFCVLLHEICHWACINYDGFDNLNYQPIIHRDYTDPDHDATFHGHARNCYRAFGKNLFQPPLRLREITADERV